MGNIAPATTKFYSREIQFVLSNRGHIFYSVQALASGNQHSATLDYVL